MNFTVNLHDLAKIETELNQLEPAIAYAVEAALADFIRVYRDVAIEFGLIESGRFVRSIEKCTIQKAVGRMTAREFIIENTVGYSSIIEFGRKDEPNRKARFPVKVALDRIDAQNYLQRRIDEEFDKIMKH